MLTAPTHLITPDEPSYDDARVAWNAAVDQTPAAVALPTTVEDVVEAISWARAYGLRVAPQSTGHTRRRDGRPLRLRCSSSTGGLTEVSIDLERGVARARRRRAVGAGG